MGYREINIEVVGRLKSDTLTDFDKKHIRKTLLKLHHIDSTIQKRGFSKDEKIGADWVASHLWAKSNRMDKRIYFDKNLKTIRKSMGMSQEKFAEAIKGTRAMIGSYEEGRSFPTLKALIDISDLTGLTLDELIRVELKNQDVKGACEGFCS